MIWKFILHPVMTSVARLGGFPSAGYLNLIERFKISLVGEQCLGPVWDQMVVFQTGNCIG